MVSVWKDSYKGPKERGRLPGSGFSRALQQVSGLGCRRASDLGRGLGCKGLALTLTDAFYALLINGPGSPLSLRLAGCVFYTTSTSLSDALKAIH